MLFQISTQAYAMCNVHTSHCNNSCPIYSTHSRISFSHLRHLNSFRSTFIALKSIDTFIVVIWDLNWYFLNNEMIFIWWFHYFSFVQNKKMFRNTLWCILIQIQCSCLVKITSLSFVKIVSHKLRLGASWCFWSRRCWTFDRKIRIWSKRISTSTNATATHSNTQ